MCPSCRSLEWETVEASGRGTVYSFVTNHYPQVPSFDYPAERRPHRAGGGRAPGQQRRRRRRPTPSRSAWRSRSSSWPSTTSSRCRSSDRWRHAMDFSFTEEQEAVRQLAEQVFTGTATVERVKEVEASEDRDRPRALEGAGHDRAARHRPARGPRRRRPGPGRGLPRARGPGPPGRPRAATGRPSWPRETLAEFGTEDQQARLAAGRRRRRGRADAGPRGRRVGAAPVGEAVEADGQWTLRGTWPSVPALPVADAVLVPARVGDDVRVFLVETAAAGVSVEAAETHQPVPGRSPRPGRRGGHTRRRRRRPRVRPPAGARGPGRRVPRRLRGGHPAGRGVHLDPRAVRQAAVDQPGRRAPGG